MAPTPPFAQQFADDLAGETAWSFETRLGPIATVRGFCCDSPNDGVNPDGKAPTAGFTLSPNPAFIGETVSYDGTQPTLSYDPDGTVTGWAWTFESHTPSSGTAETGTLNYSEAGTFTIQLIVTDGTGVKSTPARTELVVRDITLDVWAATSGGLFRGIAEASSSVAWTSYDTGLSGDDLIVYDVKLDPATRPLPDASKTLWRATTGGIQVSNDGGSSWAEKNPGTVTNQWSDGTAPTIADLTFRNLLWSGSRLFVAATWQSGTDYRSWVFYTDDTAAMRSDTSGTVTWTQLTTNWEA